MHFVNRPTRPAKPDAPKESLHWLVIRGARHNNLKSIDVPFPLGTFSVVTGVSGSGKSSLVNDILYKSLAKTLHRANTQPGAYDLLEGIEHLNKVIRVDQQPIGLTPTSNPATYTGTFDQIRELFAQLPEARVRGYSARRFSFNVPGGRCEKCEGAGQIKIEMHFLPDVWIQCDACEGRRYDAQTLAVLYRDKSIADVLEMTCGEAVELFHHVPGIRRNIQTLCDVGLDYIALGQSAPTLSGGEAQRVKLAAELARPDTGRTLYLLDEPTTGLHFDDLQNLLNVLHRLVDLGNTVIVIEHNLDVIKNADWIVDLGPEAGNDGGNLVFAGTPEELVELQETGDRRQETEIRRQEAGERRKKKGEKRKEKEVFLSYTAQALLPVFEAGKFADRKEPTNKPRTLESAKTKNDLREELGIDAKMPWETDGPRWHTKDRVSRTGQPIRWDGKILAEVARRIEDSQEFAPISWNHRSVVEVTAKRKQLGWFLHAITAEEWLLKMKFRVPKNTFNKSALIARLDLKPLNDMEEIPLYGTKPRVRVIPKGRWQEIEIRAHSWKEIDRQEFWDFLDMGIKEFANFAADKLKPNDLMPWKVLGEAWHRLPRGLIGGNKLQWDLSLLTELFEMIGTITPDLRIIWTNKVLVPFYRPASRRTAFHKEAAEERVIPDVVVHTKRVDAVYVDVYVPKNSVPLGRIRTIGNDPHVNGENAFYDILQFKFTEKKELKAKEFQKLLQEALVG
ncbi:MAG: ATP-binding cassette domain-containing protein [Planctomycetaceae bacterium]|nr:ATP-binding cassette domain-containing protein [Planctomycetaceae bacterium]